MFISLLPIMVQQASSLSYDVMNYLEVMLALGFITNLAYSKRFTNRNFIQVVGLAILLLATKPNNILLLGLIPFVPFEFEGALAFLNRPVQSVKTFISKYKAVFYLLFVVGLVVVLQFLMKNQGGLRHYGEVLRNTLFNPELNDNLNGILSHTKAETLAAYLSVLPEGTTADDQQDVTVTTANVTGAVKTADGMAVVQSTAAGYSGNLVTVYAAFDTTGTLTAQEHLRLGKLASDFLSRETVE